jgi:hypothetical protein
MLNLNNEMGLTWFFCEISQVLSHLIMFHCFDGWNLSFLVTASESLSPPMAGS